MAPELFILFSIFIRGSTQNFAAILFYIAGVLLIATFILGII